MKKHILFYIILLISNFTFSQIIETTEVEDIIIEGTEEIEIKNNNTIQNRTVEEKLVIFYSLDEALKNPEEVKYLQIRDKGLKKLPKDIAKLINLETLRVHHNYLEEIPSFIFNMKKIKHLEIGANKLGTIPDDIEKMIGLEYLGLKANGLKILPESIGNLTNLETLDLDFNPMESLPESITKLINLKNIYCSHSNFSDIERAKIEKLLRQNRGY